MMHLLGEGAFGCVYYAELKPPASEDSSLVTPIAVKMLKGKNKAMILLLSKWVTWRVI